MIDECCQKTVTNLPRLVSECRVLVTVTYTTSELQQAFIGGNYSLLLVIFFTFYYGHQTDIYCILYLHLLDIYDYYHYYTACSCSRSLDSRMEGYPDRITQDKISQYEKWKKSTVWKRKLNS